MAESLPRATKLTDDRAETLRHSPIPGPTRPALGVCPGELAEAPVSVSAPLRLNKN